MSDAEYLHREIASYVYAFVQRSALPQLAQEVVLPTLSFRSADRPEFDATVSLSAGRNAYRIRVFHGLMDRLYESLVYLANEEPDQVLRCAPATSADDACNQIYLHALSFVTFHELSHILAGHLDCWAAHYAGKAKLPASFSEAFGFGFNETKAEPRTSVAETKIPGTRFRRLSEFEADGTALELLFEFGDEIAGMLRVAGETAGSEGSSLYAGLAAGALLPIFLFEDLRETDHPENAEHPFPQARVLNLFSNFVKLSAPDSFTYGTDGGTIFHQKEEIKPSIVHLFREVLFPAVRLVLSLDGARVGKASAQPLLFSTSKIKPLMQQLVELVTQGKTTGTMAGRELALLDSEKYPYLLLLSPYRKTDWWKL